MKPIDITPELIQNYKKRTLVSYKQLARMVNYNYKTFMSTLHFMRQGEPCYKLRKTLATYFNENNISKEELI
jgi:hypothetical protein